MSDRTSVLVFTEATSEIEHRKMDRIRSASAGTNPTVLVKLPRSFAVIGDTQFLPGYCALLVDDPNLDRLTDLPKAQRLEFLDSMDTLGQAVETACRAADTAFRRMNYEILGNTDPACTHTCFHARSGRHPSASADQRGSTTPNSSRRPKWLSPPITTKFGRASSPNSRTSE